jgi:hypothetical protein
MWYLQSALIGVSDEQVAAAKGLISGHITFEMKHSTEIIPAISSMVSPFIILIEIDIRIF